MPRKPPESLGQAAFGEYLDQIRNLDPNLPKQTLEEFLDGKGMQVLPKRHAGDITPLVKMLDSFVFEEHSLKPGIEPLNDRFDGMQAVIPGERIVRELGADWSAHYHYRDWTTAVETMLKERGLPRTPTFGLDYRVGMNWDSDNSVFLNIKDNILAQCHNETPELAGAGKGRAF